MKKTEQAALNAITDLVLAYRPERKQKGKPAPPPKPDATPPKPKS